MAFARQAAHLLRSAEMSPGVKIVAQLAASNGLIMDLLLQPAEIPTATASAISKLINDVDPLFMIRMIRKVIQDHDEVGAIPAPQALRLLQILDTTHRIVPALTNHLIRLSVIPANMFARMKVYC